MYIGEFEILCRLMLAAFLGAVFGMERKHRNKPIGARTHILISLAACTVAIISSYGFTELAYSYREDRPRASDGWYADWYRLYRSGDNI